MKSITRARQSGFTLIELLLVMVLVGIMTVSEIQQAQLKMEQLAASNMGKTLFEYNNAVRFWISEKQTGVTALGVTPDLQGVRVGVDWLKSADCDPAFTADKNYLGCNFLANTNGRTRLGDMQFETYFNASWNAVLGQAEIEAITVLVDDSAAPVMRGLFIGAEPRPDLAGLAAAVVGGIVQLADSPFVVATGGEAVYCIDAASRAGMCDSAVLPDPTYAVEKIVLRAANFGTANPCQWLRTDGSCNMQADLSFNPAIGFNNREILNVSRILDSGAEGMQIGAAGGYAGPTPLNDVLIIDAQMDVWQDIVVNNSDISINNGRIVVAEGATPGSGEIEAHRMVDRDDPLFGVDPSAESNLNLVDASEISNNPAVSPNLSILSDNNLSVDAPGTTTVNSGTIVASTGTSGLQLWPNNATLIANTAITLWSPGRVEIRAGANLSQFTNTNTWIRGQKVFLDAPETEITSDISDITLYSGGNPITLDKLIPNWIHDQTWLAEPGDVVPFPVCEAGWTPKVQAVPINQVLESAQFQTNGPNRRARIHWEAWMEPAGSTWIMRVDSDYANSLPNGGVAMWALVNTYCYRNLSP